MSAGGPAFDNLLEASPTNSRDLRASPCTISSRPATSDEISAELRTTANSVNLDAQAKDQGSIAGVPVLSELPSLHIDRQSANISGYAPGALGQGHNSTASTPGVAARETYFEDSYGPPTVRGEYIPNPPRLKRRLAISLSEYFCTAIAFHTTRQEFQEERSQALRMAHEEVELEEVNQRSAISGQGHGRATTGASQSMKATLTHSVVWIFAAFLCLYNGSETTNGGWSMSSGTAVPPILPIQPSI
ncbi:hypothetical protein FRC07_010632 [Ceratobasidium sp. 392]|nr:hypothetical protein FRC07_010632 [Ceratobasidium sp. 392]